MKSLLLLGMLFFGQWAIAQAPIGEGISFPNSKELIINRFMVNGSNNPFMKTTIMDFDSLNLSLSLDTDEQGQFGSRFSVVAPGYYNSDDKEDVVLVYAADNNNIKLYSPGTSTDSMDFGNTHADFTIDAKLADERNTAYGTISATAIDIDGDGMDELAVVWQDDANKQYQLKLFELDEDLVLTEGLGAANFINDNSAQPHYGYISAANLDGIGGEELVFTYNTFSSGQRHAGLVIQKPITGEWTKTLDTLITPPANLSPSFTNTHAIGDPDGDGQLEIIVALSDGGCTGCTDTYIQVVDLSGDLQSATYNTQNAHTLSLVNDNTSNTFSADHAALCLRTTDLTFDGRDEIVLGSHLGIHLFEGDDSGRLVLMDFYNTNTGSDNNQQYSQSTGFMDIADIDGDLNPEITYIYSSSIDNSGSYEHNLTIQLLQVEASTGLITSKGLLLDTTTQNNYSKQYRYDLRFADLDGDYIELGSPQHYNYTEIVQPLVILNAPPIHFDRLEDTNYDINACYNGNDCGHFSTYVWESSITRSAEVEVKSSWEVSSNLSASGSFGPLKIKAKVAAARSQAISDFESNTQTYQVSTQVVAKDDDLIYATVADYAVWEYPVYVGGELEGHILFLEPNNISNQWFPSKSWAAQSYVPDHEVGHILSYKEYPSIQDNPFADEAINSTHLGGEGFTLNNSSDYTWSLLFSEINDTAVSKSYDVKTSINAEFGLFDAGIEMSGAYAEGSHSTHKTSMQQDLNLSANLGSVDQGIGETIYKVFPYSYWAKNGALVLDYAAKPEVPSGGGTDTWWSEHYGKEQDPGFILPWRLDPEKGYTLQNDLKRYQSKHIQFFPNNPLPGDTITIRAIAHNFSLLPTEGPVEVSFYLEHPNEGGQLLTDINGASAQNTGIAIPPRESRQVEMQWVYPGGLEFPKIYAAIDPDDLWNEIHESNNIGFNILGQNGIVPDSTIITPDTGNDIGLQDWQAIKALQVFPNPASDFALLEFEVMQPARIQVQITNLEGQILHEQVDQNLHTGIYQTYINLEEFSNGHYLVHIQSDYGNDTRSLVVAH